MLRSSVQFGSLSGDGRAASTAMVIAEACRPVAERERDADDRGDDERREREHGEPLRSRAMPHAAPPARGRRAGRASPSRAPAHRARARERRPPRGRRRPPRGRSDDARRSASSSAGRARAEDERRGDEACDPPDEGAKHRVDVLVGEDRGDDREVVAVELFDEVPRTVGIVRTVPDLARASLEPARKRRLDRGRDRVADERLGSLARAAEHDLAARDEVRVRVVRQDDDRVRAARPRASRVAISSSVSPSTSVCSSPTFVRSTTRVREHVRRVVAPAEPRLDDGDVDPGCGELGERRRGDDLELRRAELPRRRRGRARPPPRSPPRRRPPGCARPSRRRAARSSSRPTRPSESSSCSIVTRRRRLAVRARRRGSRDTRAAGRRARRAARACGRARSRRSARARATSSHATAAVTRVRRAARYEPPSAASSRR